MIIKNIYYGKAFIKRLKSLPPEVIKTVLEKEKLFRMNPLHSSFRLNQLYSTLRGAWSISISSNYRIIFERQANGDILFASIGRYDLYKNW